MKHIIDSRSIVVPDNTIFYALKGVNHNGHDYISDLYSRGVRKFVISDESCISDDMQDASFTVTASPLEKLQSDAASWRKSVKAKVVAITGSNGKSVVKEWIAQLAGNDIKLSRSPRSYNSQVGVPLSLFEISPESDMALIECGISRPGEMAILESIVSPDAGIFTHFADAHDSGFTSREEKFREKSLLFRNCSYIICREGENAQALRSLLPPSCDIVTWGTSSSASYRVSVVEKRPESIHFTVDNVHYAIPFGDDASYENALNSIVFLLHEGFSAEILSKRASSLQPVAMRMEIRDGVEGSIIIKDYYNSDLASLEIALNNLSAQRRKRTKAVILSDFIGVEDEQTYRKAARLVAKAGVSTFIGIGDSLTHWSHLFENIGTALFFADTESFVSSIDRRIFRDNVILIKGARKFRFEYIGAFLQRESHTTTLEVDLDAMVGNMAAYRSRIPAGTMMAAMVKAFSYGAGSAEVASILQFNGINYLMVAYADEGMELRLKGITAPIAVMNPEPEAFDQMIEFSLEPEIYSIDILEKFEKALAIHSVKDYPIHIKLNTGMNRSGLDPQDVDKLLEFFSVSRLSLIRSVFSHLSVADDPSQDDFTLAQISLFENLSSRICSRFEHRIIRHILNSAAIERFPQFSFDMVRLGIGLYGIGGIEGIKPVSTFKSHIVSLRNITPEQSVGYGRLGRVKVDSTIAVVPVGYADGLNRHLGCSVGRMYVNGSYAPIIGNICMDACMIDVTGIDVKIGDEVEIFGPHLPVTEIAARLNTIPYEILTGISRRVKRIYFKE